MKHLQKQEILCINSPVSEHIFKDDCIFFDIETTGFSPTTSICYLIGTLQKDGDTILTDQFLAIDKKEEKEVLLSFLDVLKDKSTIITFNGMGFDIPFIEAKCKLYGIPFDFSCYQYVDIYKLVSEIKFLLKLPNYKQKTLEDFLGIHRNDIFSGGELIAVYEEYAHSKSIELESLLLLHNYEDVLGMLDLLPILTYHEILNGAYHIMYADTKSYITYEGDTGRELILTLSNTYRVPQQISHKFGDFYMTIYGDITKIRIPIYEGELRYFHSNYKDYYYLLKEDVAIHKSVAEYVDKEFRKPAKAANCYTRKTGGFLPQPDTYISPYFQKEYKDHQTYFEYTDEFISSPEHLQEYVRNLMKYLLTHKGI